MTFLLGALGLLKRIPWQIYAAAAILLAGWMHGNWRYADGRDDERARWETVVQEAKDRAVAAERAAQAAHEKRERVRVIHTETIREVARKAENAHPVEAGRDCGPVTSSVLDTLRNDVAHGLDGTPKLSPQPSVQQPPRRR